MANKSNISHAVFSNSKFDNFVKTLTLLTAAFYTSCFLTEIGYFWDIGAPAMSAFALTDHIIHAADAALSALIVGIVLYGALLAIIWIPSPKRYRRYFVFLMVVTQVVIIYIFGLSIIAAGFITCFVISGACWALALATRVKYLFAAMALMLVPVQFGQWQYQQAILESVNPSTDIFLGAKKVHGQVVFVGSDQLIWRSGQTLHLGKLDGSYEIALPIVSRLRSMLGLSRVNRREARDRFNSYGVFPHLD